MSLLCECGACRRCKARERMRVARADPAMLDVFRERDRRRYRENAERRAALARRAARWVRENPEKRRAQNAVGNAIRDCRLFKQPCEVCGREDVHGHHDDYAKPLDVRWLCPVHHAEVHKSERAA